MDTMDRAAWDWLMRRDGQTTRIDTEWVKEEAVKLAAHFRQASTDRPSGKPPEGIECAAEIAQAESEGNTQVDKRAQEIIDQNPGCTMSAAYRSAALELAASQAQRAPTDKDLKARLETAERMQNLTPLGQDEYMRELRATISSKKF